MTPIGRTFLAGAAIALGAGLVAAGTGAVMIAGAVLVVAGVGVLLLELRAVRR